MPGESIIAAEAFAAVLAFVALGAVVGSIALYCAQKLGGSNGGEPTSERVAGGEGAVKAGRLDHRTRPSIALSDEETLVDARR